MNDHLIHVQGNIFFKCGDADFFLTIRRVNARSFDQLDQIAFKIYDQVPCFNGDGFEAHIAIFKGWYFLKNNRLVTIVTAIERSVINRFKDT